MSAIAGDFAPRLMRFTRERYEQMIGAGIAEYWIVDVAAGTVEVCRGPQGDDYPDRQLLRVGDRLSPLTSSGTSVVVADLLP